MKTSLYNSYIETSEKLAKNSPREYILYDNFDFNYLNGPQTQQFIGNVSFGKLRLFVLVITIEVMQHC